MKKLIIIISIFLFSCNSEKQISLIDTSFFKNEINKTIIDGFYENDTTGIGDKIYLIKTK